MAKKKERIKHNSIYLIEVYQVNFLAHSYIYYYMNDSIIPDHEYDSICRRLIELQNDDPKLAKASCYYDVCKGLDKSASGYFIKKEDYPDKIVGIAKTLLKNMGRQIEE